MIEKPASTAVQLDECVYSTHLAGGPLILSENVPGVRSVAAGVWVRWGASHEPRDLMGVAHLIEHMIFKGTERRSAKEIALEIEGLGGSLDAYTSREHTAYYTRVLDEHLPVAIDVLADMVRQPLFREGDLDVERNVILEEIAGVEDAPEDLIFDLHARTLWGGHPYGNPVLGTAETVSAVTRDDLQRLWRSAYRPDAMVVVAAGNLRHEEVVELVTSALPSDDGPVQGEVPEPKGEKPREVHFERDSAQSHVCIGSTIFPHNDPRRYAASLVSMALGGGMSSHLFQRVREELGLAYSIYSFQSFYALAGIAGVYMATRPDMARRAIDEVLEILARIASEGFNAGELKAVKNQAKGQVMLSLESTSSRLHRLAGVALYDEPYRTLDEICELIDAVSEEDVADLCRSYYAPERQMIVRLGPASQEAPEEVSAAVSQSSTTAQSTS